MKCSTCFGETETDPCQPCATLSQEERWLLRENMRVVLGTIKMLDAAFEMAFGAKPPRRPEPHEHRSVGETEAIIRLKGNAR